MFDGILYKQLIISTFTSSLCPKWTQRQSEMKVTFSITLSAILHHFFTRREKTEIKFTFHRKNNIYIKKFTEILCIALQKGQLVLQNSLFFFFNYSPSWLKKPNYLFCSSSSSFLFIMATIAWRSSSEKRKQKGLRSVTIIAHFRSRSHVHRQHT